MPDFKEYDTKDLDWSLDFAPLHPLPIFMPVVIIFDEGKKRVVSGFDKKELKSVWALRLETSLSEALNALYPDSQLAPLEAFRKRTVLGQKMSEAFLSKLPLELQNFLDERRVPLKALKPLEYCLDWDQELTRALLSLKPSSSQVREIIDVLCDLKFKGLSFLDCIPLSTDATSWIAHLRKLLTPHALASDETSQNRVTKVSWPRGVTAKWERRGDQSGLTLQTKITNKKEWESFKEAIPKLAIEDETWIS